MEVGVFSHVTMQSSHCEVFLLRSASLVDLGV